jgi:hypothetical protein
MKTTILFYLSKQASILHGYLATNKKTWGLSLSDYQNFQEESLGFQLYQFYKEKNLVPIPKLENHDVYHILLEANTDTRSEILLQFFILGNGKRSKFTILASLGSLILFPELWFDSLLAYKRGRTYQHFGHIDFKNKLHLSVETLRQYILKPAPITPLGIQKREVSAHQEPAKLYSFQIF